MKKAVSLFIITALICALCLSAASCKSSSASNDDGGTASIGENIPGGVADVSAEVLEALANSGEVMTYGFGTEGEEVDTESVDYKREQEFLQYFEQVYGGTLTRRIIEWEGWEDTYITDFAAEDAPDVVSLFYKLWPKVANRGMVYSLPELEEEGVVGLDHPIFDDDRELCAKNFSYKKNNYAIAVEMASAIYCAVNTDLYKQYNVKSPVEYFQEGTWNMDNFIKACTELTRDSDGDEVTDIYGYNGWDLDWFVIANGGQLVRMDDEGKIYTTLDSINVVNALEIVHDLYGVKKAATDNGSFEGGRIGMYAALKTNVGKKLIEGEVTFNWDVVPFPKGDDNDGTELAGEINAAGISTSTKNAQGALNYIIANKVFNELYSEKYPDEAMSKFSEEQVTMFSDYDLQSNNAFYMGVGSLWGGQWDFWTALKGDRAVSEVLQTFQPMFEAQCELEMDSVTN